MTIQSFSKKLGHWLSTALLIGSTLSAQAITIHNNSNDRIHFNIYSAETLQEYGANTIKKGKSKSWGKNFPEVHKLNLQMWTVLPFMSYQRGLYNIPECEVTITGFESITYRPITTANQACTTPPKPHETGSLNAR